VYSHRGAEQLRAQLAGEKIHRAEALEIWTFEREFLAGFVQRLERRLAFDLSVTDRHLYLTVGGDTLSGALERVVLA
jgi:uncharacterized protein YaeQ